MKPSTYILTIAFLSCLIFFVQDGEAKLFSARIMAAEEDAASAVQLSNPEPKAGMVDVSDGEIPTDAKRNCVEEVPSEERLPAADLITLDKD